MARPPGLRPFDPRLLHQVRSVRWVFAADVAAGLIGTLLLLAQATLLAAALAALATGETTGVGGSTLVALVVVIALRAALAPLVEITGRRAATTVMSALRRRLVDRYLGTGGVGRVTAPGEDGAEAEVLDGAELATAAVQGIDGLEVYFARYLPQVVLAVTVPIAIVAWTAVVDLQSAVIMVITLPVIPVFMVLIGRSAAARSEANWLSLVALSAHFLDVVRGLPTLRAFNRGRAQIPKIRETTEQYRRTTMSTLRLAFLSGLVLDLAASLSTALIAVTLGVRLVDGSIPLRPALTVLLLVPELYAPIRNVGALFHASTDGLAAAGQILDLVATDGDDADDATLAPGAPGADGGDAVAAPPPDPAEHPVVVHGLRVHFPGRTEPALDGIDLTIEPGELLAVVGESGAGKTTLARVLLGLQPPTDGTVTVDGRPVTGTAADSWRRRVAWAPQRPTLLHASVAANIALGHPDATEAEIAEAAALAGADRFVTDLPDGYATVIGDGGRGLSAGQRQRLGLARALLRPASLLVLDEPTAHLDAESADTVGRTLDTRRGHQTIVLVTHDLALAVHADRTVVVASGRLVAPDPVGPR